MTTVSAVFPFLVRTILRRSLFSGIEISFSAAPIFWKSFFAASNRSEFLHGANLRSSVISSSVATFGATFWAKFAHNNTATITAANNNFCIFSFVENLVVCSSGDEVDGVAEYRSNDVETLLDTFG